jgi:hypothetical protein
MMTAQRPLILTISFLAVLGWTALAFGQRGMGQPRGVAQQTEKPTLQTLEGTVQKVLTEECKNTTGRYRIGTHFILKTEAGERNVHLGPAAVSPVKTTADALAEGQSVTVKAFRTSRMPAGHYNAQQIETDDQTLVLRNASLRPTWAGRRGISRGLRGMQRSIGRGNCGRGRGLSRFDGRRPGRAMRGCSGPRWRQAREASAGPRFKGACRTYRGGAGMQRGRGVGAGRAMAPGRGMMHRPAPMMGQKPAPKADRKVTSGPRVRERRINRLQQRIDQLEQRLEQLKQSD